VAVERSVPGNTTELPLTDVAVPIPGHADAAPPPTGSVGRLVVVTVQLPGVDEIVHPVGNKITTFVSVPDVDVFSHAVPEIAAPVASLLNLTKASVTEALAFPGVKKGESIEKKIAMYTITLMIEDLSFKRRDRVSVKTFFGLNKYFITNYAITIANHIYNTLVNRLNLVQSSKLATLQTKVKVKNL
jgi:hypothetical protein